MNPERRAGAEGSSGSSGSGQFGNPEGSIWSRLFPPASGPEELPPVNGAAGVRLGHFTITERIGIGGMGTVFRAIDERLQRVVALKVLAPAFSRDSAAIRRFENESRSTAQLNHESIAGVYYCGEDQGVHFIAYEYIDGTNVRDLLRRNGRFSPANAVNYALQIAAALKHIAAAGVVHRDIKPSNIIITATGRAKLVDLGLARKPRTEDEDELTIAGTTLGTFDYISPEQAKDPRNVDIRSDIYSLGCTLYHMLTNEPPYPEGTVLQKLLDHQGKEPPDPSRYNRSIPVELSQIVKRMMASSPRKRYATADQLIHDLLQVAGQLGLQGRYPEGLIWSGGESGGSQFRQRHLGWMSMAAALLVIVFLLDHFPGTGTGTTDGTGDRRSVAGSNDSQPGNSGVDHSAPVIDRGASPTTPGVPIAAVPRRSETDTVSNPDGPGDSAAASGAGTGSPAISTAGTNSGESGLPAGPPAGTGNNSRPENGTGSLTARPGDTPGGTLFDDSDLPLLSRGRPDADGTGTTSAETTAENSTGGSETPTEVAVNSTGNPATSPGDIDPETSPLTDSGNSRPPAEAPAPQVAGVDPTPIIPPIAFNSPPIAIVSQSADEPKLMPTLEAACAEAKDGDIIELRYNGSRQEAERPLRITNKNLTIRAGRDEKGVSYRPVLLFGGEDSPVSRESRMMTLVRSAVRLINVDVIMQVDSTVSTEPWALFSLQGAEAVRLESVNVTVMNAHDHPAAVFELTTGAGTALANMELRMNMGTAAAPEEFDLKVRDSYIRGTCDLIAARHTRPGRCELTQSAFALHGSLLSMPGSMDMPPEGTDVELRLEHTTCILGNGLLSVDIGTEGREVSVVSVTAENNLFATNTSSPLISMQGARSLQDFRALLRWRGEKNFFDRYQQFWSVAVSLPGGSTDALDFDGWKDLLANSSDSGTISVSNRPVAWMSPWNRSEFAQLESSELALDAEAVDNPPVSGATDDSDAGAHQSRLPARAPTGDFRPASLKDGETSPGPQVPAEATN